MSPGGTTSLTVQIGGHRLELARRKILDLLPETLSALQSARSPYSKLATVRARSKHGSLKTLTTADALRNNADIVRGKREGFAPSAARAARRLEAGSLRQRAKRNWRRERDSNPR